MMTVRISFAFLNRQERAATAKDINKTAYLISKTDARSLSLKSISADDRTERHPRIREKGSWAALLRKMKTEPVSRLCQKYSIC
jgi:hypothetical protein